MALSRSGGTSQFLADTTAPTSFDVSFSTAPAADDIIVVFMSNDNTTGGMTLPTNLTWAAGQAPIENGDAQCEGAMWWAKGDGVEGDAANKFTFSWTGKEATFVWSEVVSGADTTTPMDATATTDIITTTATTHTSPSITTVTDGALVYRMLVVQARSTLTSPSGPTELANGETGTLSPDINAAITVETQATAGATGTKAFTSANNRKHVMITVAVRLAASGGVSGTGAVALGALVAAGSGTVTTKISGTGAVPLGALTVSGIGTVPGSISGTGAVSLGALVVSGTGTVSGSISGTGSVSLGVLAVAGIGTASGTAWEYTPPTETVSFRWPSERRRSERGRGPEIGGQVISIQRGRAVLLNSGVYSLNSGPTVAQLAAADAYYLGGHIATVDTATKDAIEASGVGGTFVLI